MDDLSYLPLELASKSLSTKEIVLTLPDTVEAVRLLAEQNVAVIEWETWGLHPGGRKGGAGGHRSDYPNRHAEESWTDFVERTAWDCLETARHAVAHLQADSKYAGVEVYFCLSIAAERW